MSPYDALKQFEAALANLLTSDMNCMTFEERDYIRNRVPLLLKPGHKGQIDHTLRTFKNKVNANKTLGSYQRVATLTTEAGLYLIEKSRKDVRFAVTFGKHKIPLSSLRLRTFLEKGIKCSMEACPLEISLFAVERQAVNTGYHLNPYAIDAQGQEVLFTYDHILARCLGGTDTIDNVQTMCWPHNHSKSKLENNKINLARAASMVA